MSQERQDRRVQLLRRSDGAGGGQQPAELGAAGCDDVRPGGRAVGRVGRGLAGRARQTGAAERTIYRQAARIDAQGRADLLPPTPAQQQRRLPPAVRRANLALKAEHPPFRPQEIVSIIDVRFGYSVGHHTVTRLLATEATAPPAARRFAPYHEIADPAERRLAIIRLFATRHPSPQPLLPPLADVEWRAALRLPPTRGRRRPPAPLDAQPALFSLRAEGQATS